MGRRSWCWRRRPGAASTPRHRRSRPARARRGRPPRRLRSADGRTLDGELRQTLQDDLDRIREAQSLVGVSAAVVVPGKDVWTGTSGVADQRTDEPVTTDTLFAVGSVTKPLVAALMVQLAERGEFDLDDHLSRWVPDFPNSDEITLRQLLGHTSGAANFTDDPAFYKAQDRRPGAAWSPRDTLRYAQDAGRGARRGMGVLEHQLHPRGARHRARDRIDRRPAAPPPAPHGSGVLAHPAPARAATARRRGHRPRGPRRGP